MGDVTHSTNYVKVVLTNGERESYAAIVRFLDSDWWVGFGIKTGQEQSIEEMGVETNTRNIIDRNEIRKIFPHDSVPKPERDAVVYLGDPDTDQISEDDEMYLDTADEVIGLK